MKLINLAVITGLGVVLSACGGTPVKGTDTGAVKPAPPKEPTLRPPPSNLPGSIKGSVLDKSNRPIPNIVVELIPKQCFQPTRAVVRTNGVGEYQFNGVPSGAYVVGLNGFSSKSDANKNPRYHSTCSDRDLVTLHANQKHGVIRHWELQPKPVRR